LYTASGRGQVTVYRRRRFPQRYTRAGIELLASVDEAHQTLSGPSSRLKINSLCSALTRVLNGQTFQLSGHMDQEQQT